MNKKLCVYLVSDSSGETVLHVVNAVLSQFNDVNVNKFMWPMVRTQKQIDALAKALEIMPGIVYYTLVNEEIEVALIEVCAAREIPYISVIRDIVQKTSKVLDMEISRKTPGAQHHILNEEYNARIKAMEFTLVHDDGQSLNTVHGADILLIGVSRTSKSPTSLFLAQRGFKTANIPYVPQIGIGVEVEKLEKTLVVGLTISPERLKMIRSTRLLHLGNENSSGEYADLQSIKHEVIDALKYFKAHNIEVIDVTGRAIEETSADIMNMYNLKFGRM